MRSVATTAGEAPVSAMPEQDVCCLDRLPPCGSDSAPKRSVGVPRRAAPVVVAASNATSVLPAAVNRVFRQRTKLLVWTDDAPRPWHLARRLALHVADAVLVGDEVTEAEVIRAGKPASAVFNVPGPYAIDAFLRRPPGRTGEAVRRLVVCGGLAPDGDGLAILASAAAWAECHPSRRLELCWVGSGDLRLVLAAQSLPDNLVQRFSGAQDLAGTAAEFLQSGVLVAGAACRADLACRGELLAQAMASGLVVLFDRECPVAGRLLRHGVTGIGYQAGRAAGLLDALGDVMDASAGTLDQMRVAARMHVLPMNPQGFEDRLGRAVQSVMRESAAGLPDGHSFAPAPVLQAR